MLSVIPWKFNQYSTDFLSISIIKAASISPNPHLHLSLSNFDKCHLHCKQRICSFISGMVSAAQLALLDFRLGICYETSYTRSLAIWY